MVVIGLKDFDYEMGLSVGKEGESHIEIFIAVVSPLQNCSVIISDSKLYYSQWT